MDTKNTITSSNNFGATPEEWQKYTDLWLIDDLLPVVSNRGAPISAHSDMKQAGKTPSLYNRQGYVSGISKWTEKIATLDEVQRWSKEPDYGICIQTRLIRALDIDVDDQSKVDVITDFISDWLVLNMPTRFRNNSGKCLLAFMLGGRFGKRVLKVDGGMIEFLANGQQFIAAGTHPSGARYEWEWHGQESFPRLSEEEFETLWMALENEFAIAESTQQGLRNSRDSNALALIEADDTMKFLEGEGLVLSYGPEGQAHIECPFSEDHTSESSVSATSYFPKGGRGYEQGHFVCLHAHCQGRNNGDYLNALGVVLADFEELPVVTREDYDPIEDIEEPPPYERDRFGRPKATIDNVIMAVERSDICGAEICYDAFRDETIFYGKDRSGWEHENDERYIKLRRRLERLHKFLPIGKDMIRDAVRVVAKDNEIDTAQEWLNSLEWDGVPRIEKFATHYLGAIDSEYTNAVSLYMWSALAGRVLKPGVKADMAPVLKGAQSLGKSSAIAAIAPSLDEFCEIDFGEKDTDLARKMRGKLVAEIAELRGLRTKDNESIKAFVSRTHEEWIPKYREFSVSFPRRLLFIATTNEDQFLTDSTGNRRWLPFDVVNTIDVEKIKTDRPQLWAEARELFKKEGVVFGEAERLAEQQHENYMIRDSWFDVIGDWLHKKNEELDGTTERPVDLAYLRTLDVAVGALNIDARQLKRAEEMKIGDALKALGYERLRKKVSGQRFWAWYLKGEGCENA